jgi:cellulose biosynthesis protein BcsQ
MLFDSPGQVITFYSYKGGTGRSMAVANIGCLLAQYQAGGKGVLMVDWDLEAPGLHRFFHNRYKHIPGSAEDRELDKHPGLIDLFSELKANCASKQHSGENAPHLLDDSQLDRFILEIDLPGCAPLHLLKAGCFDKRYAFRVNTFPWEEFYNQSPWLIQLLIERLTERYQYVLIDSRTGITDISDICTMLMPEKLVVVFTPNRQSLTGVLDLIRQAAKYRLQSDDLRPLAVFPLPSRIELTESALRDDWRFGNPDQGIIGYQPLFEALFKEIYNLPKCVLNNYFNEVQIQHVPSYAYGEEIAVLVERGRDTLSLTRSYERFTNRLVNLAGPWEDLDWTTAEQQYPPSETCEIFFSYAHADEALLDELEKHLSILRRQGVITGWHDRKIGAGMEWEGEIDTHLEIACVILLLISPDYLASDYFLGVEMKRALERHESGEARVIPVILRPVYWQDTPFAKLQALPTDAKPVSTWVNRDEAFLDIAKGIQAAVEERRWAKSVMELIAHGESSQLEFKSTMRYNLHTQKRDKELEKDIAKTLCGFMNAEGGTLIIGVDDHGNPLGLADDLSTLRKKDLDGLELALSDIVREYLGHEYLQKINCEFATYRGKRIGMIKVEKSLGPVFYQGDVGREFYARIGNFIQRLDAKGVLDYIRRRF